MPVMSKTLELQEYKSRLLKERDRVAELVAGFRDEFSHTQTSETEENGLETHMGDVATDMYLRERDLSVQEQEEHLLEEIDAALVRVENGTFGVCSDCGEAIASARLDALPWATRCIDCQSKL